MNIAYPLRTGTRGRTETVDVEQHIRDLIEQVLFTSQGERVNRPDFGSGLMQVVFAPNSEALLATVQVTVQGALQQWLGDIITVEELVVSAEDATLQVVLRYRHVLDGRERTAGFSRSLA
jgi:phage baseplate assembly protein W